MCAPLLTNTFFLTIEQINGVPKNVNIKNKSMKPFEDKAVSVVKAMHKIFDLYRIHQSLKRRYFSALAFASFANFPTVDLAAPELSLSFPQ